MQLHYKQVGVLLTESGKPYNPRGYPGDTTDLQEQIARDGQRTPISVTEPTREGIYVITRGHRRKAAIDSLRSAARAKVRELTDILESLEPDQTEQRRSITKQLTEQQALVEQYTYYDVAIQPIQTDDIEAILADMDAGIINKVVDPIALGETIMFRMDQMGWTFRRCIESLGLDDPYGRACLHAADPTITSSSVQHALRSGEMSLSQFIRKMKSMDRQTQDRVMQEAERRAKEDSRSHGVINAKLINRVIESMQEKPEEAPDAPVLPLLATAYESLEQALRLAPQWSDITQQTAEWRIEELLLLIDSFTKTRERWV